LRSARLIAAFLGELRLTRLWHLCRHFCRLLLRAGSRPRQTIGGPLDDCAVRRNPRSRPNQDDVSQVQGRQWNHLSLGSGYAFGGVWEECRQRIERAASLSNGFHFQPMAEDHDRNQGGQFPPDFNFEQAEGCGKRRSKCDHDGQADERHHAGFAVGKFAPCPTDEHEPAINKDDRRDGLSKAMAAIGEPSRPHSVHKSVSRGSLHRSGSKDSLRCRISTECRQ
jgi:hypothetical protein